MTPRENGKNALEWTIFVLSCLLIAATLGFLLWENFRNGDEPADVRLALGPPFVTNGETRIPVQASNLGSRSAQTVEVEVVHETGLKSVLSFEFISRGETRRGYAVFPGALPDGFSARVLGYQEE